jgi:hypothetical protein
MNNQAESWWELPGPSAFLADVLRTLHNGVNAVVMVPDVCPGPIRQPILRGLRREDCLSIDELPASTSPSTRPAALVQAACGLEPGIATAADLVRCQRFRGRAVYVRELSAGAWPAWMRFLDEYASAVRRLEEHERSVFCVEVSPTLPGLPQDDVTLRVLRWQGVVGQLDMLLFALKLQPQAIRTLGPVLQHIHARSVAELAGFDGCLAQELSTLGLEDLPNATGLCLRFGQRKGWCASMRSGWETGTLARVDGDDVEHLGWLAHRPDFGRALSRRLWRAQVTVVFPLLETLRWQVIDRHHRSLRIPWENRSGVVQQVGDLELGDLAVQLHRVAPSGLVETLRTLRTMRNKLAHLECLSCEELRHVAAVRIH